MTYRKLRRALRPWVRPVRDWYHRITRGEPMLVFLHMPKTAGTHMREVLRQHMPDDRTLELYSPAQIAFWNDAALNRNYDAIFGHTGYALLHRITRPVRSITVLRDPVERVLSLYYFWREVDTVPGDPGPELARNLDLMAFVTSDHPTIIASIQNAMAWFYYYDLSIPARHDLGGISEWDLLHRAAANLDRISFLCLQERFPESLAALTRCYGWPDAPDVATNANPNRPRRGDISPEVIQAIEARVGVDMALYKHGQQRAAWLIEEFAPGRGCRHHHNCNNRGQTKLPSSLPT